MTRKEAFIALNMVPHLGPVRLRRLLEIFGSPDRVLTAGRNELQGVEGLNPALVDSLVSWESVVDLKQELARIQEFGATILTLDDAEYPPCCVRSTIRPRFSTLGSARGERSTRNWSRWFQAHHSLRVGVR